MNWQTKDEKQYDINMLFVLFLFAVISCISIYYAQQMPQYEGNFVVNQGIYFVLAFTVMFVLIHIDYEYYLTLSWAFYGGGLALLVLLEIISPNEQWAPTRNNAERWFELPVIGSFQPSEVMKVALILTMSTLVYKHNQKFTNKIFKNDIWLIAKLLLVLIPPVLLLRLQPDMGMVMMSAALFFSIVIVSGVSVWLNVLIFGVPLSVGLLFLFAFFRFPHLVENYIFTYMADYQVSRFYGWLNPMEYTDEGFQTARAISAIGSGRLTGSEGTTVYLPEAHTDFIFAVIGEQFGFVGAAVVMTLFFILLYQMMVIALKANHSFGAYICAGSIGMLAFQIFQNVGMNLGLLPVTGFTLPLISFGGSSLVTTMALLGIIMSVRYHARSYFFES
ncbi:cell division protein FtsW (lipid II flippase) [Salsuginibacillus halophilus]|uniref:Cell division protein FtsW (Lipid II flippase) n=1 Tax=Salsuginibacillus halophilus TaxID=517424 RepID=A0A2P8HXR7_9BACI|nr:FtsW/RodA/SpoVE family cell cycle protein [Salsuginibacillus halophilus]PSL50998.1 cell division protein FtsW (lipid II flippase) [Salsuginibacillus halophilus]